MNAIFFVFHDGLEKYKRSGGYEGTHIDGIYADEIKGLVQECSHDIFSLYVELTYMYVRYTGTNLHYLEVPTFLKDFSDNPTLFMISHLRSILAFNILDFYEQLIFEATNIMNTTLKEKISPKGPLLNIFRTFKPTINPEEKFVDLNVSICEIAEYISFLKSAIDCKKIPDEELEFLIAVNTFFGFINRSEVGKWEDCSSFLIKTFNLCTNDGNREDGFLNFNGHFIFEIFRKNASLPKKCLKDVNLWVLSGYKFKLDEMSKGYDDICEGIEREEYSEENILRCEEYIRVAWNIYKSFLFLNWTISTMTIKYAEKIILVYQQALQKITQFKD